MAQKADVSQILDKVSKGSKTSKAELEAVASAAESLRDEFFTQAEYAEEGSTPKLIDMENFEDCRDKTLWFVGLVPERASTKSELDRVASGAASLRDQFLAYAFEEINTTPPRSEKFEKVKACLSAMTELLMKHGFVTVGEVQLMWLKIQQVEA